MSSGFPYWGCEGGAQPPECVYYGMIHYTLSQRAIMLKQCTKCLETKEIKEFNKIRKTHRAQCKSCTRVAAKNQSSNKICPQCSQKCWAKNGAVCGECKLLNSQERYKTLTLGDKTYDNHKYAKYSYVRYFARKQGIDLGWTQCCKCGYDKHFEVCHIKPISSFPPDTLLIDINHPDNLMALCPNCHWEFDNIK